MGQSCSNHFEDYLKGTKNNELNFEEFVEKVKKVSMVCYCSNSTLFIGYTLLHISYALLNFVSM